MLLAVFLLPACGGPTSDPVFESVGFVEIECPNDAPEDSECLLMTAAVAGTSRGTGSCVVYAAGSDRNLFVAADSGILDLEPGNTVSWTAVLMPSSDPAFVAWNPVCAPMAEG